MKAALVIVGIAVVLSGSIMVMSNRTATVPAVGGVAALASNVSVVDGTQIITITTKGGYTPTKSNAKAGMPTVLRFETNGTFDCSSSVRIPSLSIDKVPSTGTTDINVGVPTLATLQGTCGMGMYHFAVVFE
jgi:plastocyanin domain-containing protein